MELREHKFSLQLFHHILRKYSFTQANPKAYCQQINYGFTQLVHKLRCVQGKMIVPPEWLLSSVFIPGVKCASQRCVLAFASARTCGSTLGRQVA